MRTREVLIFPEILNSKKVAALSPFAQLFYRNLMHVCDGAGVFENDPNALTKFLYPQANNRVQPEAITKWLKECQAAGLIRFTTDDEGRALGEFTKWLRKDLNRKRRYQHSREQTPEELTGLFSADPPDPNKENRIEEKEKEPDPALPEGLGEDFLRAWQNYVAHRRALKIRKLKSASIERQWQLMASWGEAAAIEAIETTIRNGWQGIFDPKRSTGRLQKTKATLDPLYNTF